MGAFKMKIDEVREKYDSTHFGNDTIAVGNTVWIRETDGEGTYAMPVEIVA